MIAISMIHQHRADLRALIAAAASEPGRYQLTWSDDRGPSGHTTRDTPYACVLVALQEGFRASEALTPESQEVAAHALADYEATMAEIAAMWEEG